MFFLSAFWHKNSALQSLAKRLFICYSLNEHNAPFLPLFRKSKLKNAPFLSVFTPKFLSVEKSHHFRDVTKMEKRPEERLTMAGTVSPALAGRYSPVKRPIPSELNARHLAALRSQMKSTLRRKVLIIILLRSQCRTEKLTECQNPLRY